MPSSTLHEFLESSTIHGLVHISTAKSRSARAVWVVIVVACFAIAMYMITSSYKEWQESPVSTTITTHPITELEFQEFIKDEKVVEALDDLEIDAADHK